MEDSSLDKKGIIKAMTIAIVIAFIGIGILGWQYRRLEKERIPALEQEIEQRDVKDALDSFMQLRIQGKEDQFLRHLTERVVERAELISKIESYEIVSVEKMAEDEYRFAVRIYQEGELTDFIEVIKLIKIIDRYYVDSIELAG